METLPYLIHALSPVHAGTGHSLDAIDLPIARLRSTGIPFIPGSSIKGVLRDARRSLPASRLAAIFGPGTEQASEHAGALIVGDARLLALPVRSFRGTFAWVTSPLLLRLAARDLEGAEPPAVPTAEGTFAKVGAATAPAIESLLLYRSAAGSFVFLEDLDLVATTDALVTKWAAFLASRVYAAQPGVFSRRFVVVDDESMTFLWETATQVDARVRIDPDRRTAEDGALWSEESLPPETLLVGLLGADRARRRDVELSARDVLTSAIGTDATLQFGGKASVGRGRCRMLPVAVDAPAGVAV